MVLPAGLEPASRSNLELTDYKSGVLPIKLQERVKKNYFSKDSSANTVTKPIANPITATIAEYTKATLAIRLASLASGFTQLLLLQTGAYTALRRRPSFARTRQPHRAVQHKLQTYDYYLWEEAAGHLA